MSGVRGACDRDSWLLCVIAVRDHVMFRGLASQMAWRLSHLTFEVKNWSAALFLLSKLDCIFPHVSRSSLSPVSANSSVSKCDRHFFCRLLSLKMKTHWNLKTWIYREPTTQRAFVESAACLCRYVVVAWTKCDFCGNWRRWHALVAGRWLIAASIRRSNVVYIALSIGDSMIYDAARSHRVLDYSHIAVKLLNRTLSSLNHSNLKLTTVKLSILKHSTLKLPTLEPSILRHSTLKLSPQKL